MFATTSTPPSTSVNSIVPFTFDFDAGASVAVAFFGAAGGAGSAGLASGVGVAGASAGTVPSTAEPAGVVGFAASPDDDFLQPKAAAPIANTKSMRFMRRSMP